MDTTDKVLLTIGFGIGFVFSFVLGFEVGEKRVRKEALLLKHATYISDSDGNAKFTWKQ
jgi:hypothetical protein